MNSHEKAQAESLKYRAEYLQRLLQEPQPPPVNEEHRVRQEGRLRAIRRELSALRWAIAAILQFDKDGRLLQGRHGRIEDPLPNLPEVEEPEYDVRKVEEAVARHAQRFFPARRG